MLRLALLIVLSITLAGPVVATASEQAVDDSVGVALPAGAAQWLEDFNTNELAFPEALRLVPRVVVPWVAGTRVRFQQELMGIPVYGSEVILSLDKEGAVRRVHGKPLSVVLLDPHPDYPSAAAELSAQQAVHDIYGQGALWPARSTLGVTLDSLGHPRLVWQVDASASEPVGMWRFFFDAHTGAPLGHHATFHTARGYVYPSNPVASELTEVDLPEITGAELSGTYAVVRSCASWVEEDTECTEKTTHSEPDSDGNFLYSPDATSLEDPLAEIQMYYHLDVISRWFASEFNFQHDFGLLQGQAIEGVVNFDYNNAFWGDVDGDGIGEVSFGQTINIDFAYDADVIYHEFGHSVFGRIVNPGFIGADEYGIEWATGALNEGTADFFSLAMTGDPDLGEYAGAGFGFTSPSIRDLDEDKKCPDDLYGESHRDGMVWGSMGWNMLDDEVLGFEVTPQLIYGAISSWPSDVNWGTAGQSIVDAAEDMLDAGELSQEQYDAVIAHGTDSGVIGCGRVIRLDDEQEPTQMLVNVGFVADAQIPLGNQFSLDVPDNAERLRFRIKGFLASHPNMAWSLYVRRGDHIVHDLQELGFFEVPVPDIYDEAIDGEGEDFSYDLRLDSDPALEPGATYYFSIASRRTGSIDGFQYAEVTVDGDVWLDESEDDPDEDDDDGAFNPFDPNNAGCQDCRTNQGGGHPSTPWAVLPLLLLGIRRRRER